ncbi:hypothetical protein [Pedobacter sp. FW305-3-2-15-E-R2A2]|uniref:HD domain-containing protein n=1 Tax=Pedobacter sp. FW305-3-2-15-E-R2A2 TaxID=3140251 RepID=UPI0031403E92
MPTAIQNPFIDLPIWEHFLKTTENETDNRQMVINHIGHALPLLERIIVAYPSFTLHNAQHQHNILRLIGEILGIRLQGLSGLETAILILSAVYHDIGMVYKPEELKTVSLEPEFEEFLFINTAAKLQFEEDGKQATESLIGWYCRWMHAKRVWPFLQDVDSTIPFVWDKVPFKVELGNVCESHNSSIEYIKNNDDKFSVTFLGKCDLKFCALLLRIGDILDFDDTRTPLSLYEYLGLDKSNKADDQISDKEWRQHMSAKGFTVEREHGRTRLRFIAVPEHPKVEVGIRSFLKIIETELNACARLLRFCSDEWVHFELPDEINLEGIKSKNYRSGNYHFSLAEDDVMKLLTGEGIYNDDFIFLRELLQNAIDTSRHREFRERLVDSTFHASPIIVSNFTDDEGYQWIRIDDYGMGMNLEIIEKHLLKKGKSYYNSDAFKLEKLAIREKIHADFVPISRFGIGLLSCFIAGDKIEISTVHKDEPNNPYRLSVEGRNGFFMLQSKKEHDTPAPMPAENKPEKDYRKKPGTSIAVRIVTNKEYEGFDVKALLERYLMAPPVPVEYDGTAIGGDFKELMDTPWATAQSFELNEEYVNKVRTLTELPLESGIKISILPISLTQDALSSNIKGQLIITYIDIPEHPLLRDDNIRFTLDSQNRKIEVQCVKTKKKDGKTFDERETEDVSFLFDHLKIPDVVTLNPYSFHPYHLNVLRFSHNGIRIPEDTKTLALNRGGINSYQLNWGHLSNFNFICSGVVYFQDELLPNLTVSRNEIREMTFPTVAHLLVALRSLNRLIYDNPEQHQFNFFERLEHDVEFTSGIIEKSRFYESHREFWNQEIKIHTGDGVLSVDELIEKSPNDLEIFNNYHSSAFYRNLIKYILESNFDISVAYFHEEGSDVKRFYLSTKSTVNSVIVEGFEPQTFMRFKNHSSLLPGKEVNIDHPYTKWYASAYPLLTKEYFHYSMQLIHGLFGSWESNKPEIEKINRILDKLRKVLPEDLRPLKEINLKRDDFQRKEVL